MTNPIVGNVRLPRAAEEVLKRAKALSFVDSKEQLVELAVPSVDRDGYYSVSYDVPGKGSVVEAKVCRVRNGVVANYPEPYMRRRDPDCMVIADQLPTDKSHFLDRFGKSFESLRQETFDWLTQQELAYFYFHAGKPGLGTGAVAICPMNAGFFAMGLGLLQGVVSRAEVEQGFTAEAVIYIAPPFRHTHFDGRQVVVHNRLEGNYELFSYNLYPGPSAKKGVYGMLLTLGEKEGWVTTHCSTVQAITPYENITTIMHEGASGGGKSEMLENPHREPDGRVLLGKNVVTDEHYHVTLPQGCELHPVTDDMALCHPSLQKRNRTGARKLSVTDAEDAWFMRVNHITEYGTDPHLEKLTTSPPTPLLFLNIDAVPGSRALIWEHTEDAPGKPCSNPRVVVPREHVPNIVNRAVTVDIRSFGVRCPPCTKEQPTYGIIGLLQFLPPALAWLWRLVAPRGHDNPSIVDSGGGMSAEGVGSYWPFATGRKVDQANLLLQQVLDTTDTLFVLCPNQHIGAWKTGFAPQWVAREYLARRGSARQQASTMVEARCTLLGRTAKALQIEGQHIPDGFLRPELQPEIGLEAYDVGAKILTDFFHSEIRQFLSPDLDPRGKEIIMACLRGATVSEYDAFTPVSNDSSRPPPLH